MIACKSSQFPLGQRFWRPTIAAVMLAWFGPSTAGVWHQSVSLPATFEYDSNPTLAVNNPTSIWRARIEPDYRVSGTFGGDEISAGLGLNIEQSSNNTVSQDRQDPRLLVGWRRQTDTGELGLNARYQTESLRTTELTETGAISPDGTRTTGAIAGNWRRTINERSYIAPNAEYKVVTYDRGTSPDYTNTSGGLTYGYIWSERAEPTLQVLASRYDPDSVVEQSEDNYSLLGGLKFNISERLDMAAQLGASKVVGRVSDSGWIGNISLRHTGLTSDFSIELGRSVNLSGQDGFYAADRLSGTWSYAFDSKTRLGVDGSVQDTRGSAPNRLYQFGVWMGYEIAPLWNLRGYSKYTFSKPDGQPDAYANVIGLTLIYNHPDL